MKITHPRISQSNDITRYHFRFESVEYSVQRESGRYLLLYSYVNDDRTHTNFSDDEINMFVRIDKAMQLRSKLKAIMESGLINSADETKIAEIINRVKSTLTGLRPDEVVKLNELVKQTDLFTLQKVVKKLNDH